MGDLAGIMGFTLTGEEAMTDQATEANACAEMGALTDEHKLFEPFAGTFTAEVKMWMGPGEPMVSTGVMTNTLDLGGRFLHQCYKGDVTEGPFPDFEGRGYWGFNTTTRKWEGVWIDTASTCMQTDQGEIDAAGETWTMIGPEQIHPATGQPMQKKSVIHLQDDDHHSMEMYFKTPEGEMKVMEISYTRRH